MKRYVVPASIAALAVAQALFVGAYIVHEHTFYFWDHAMYHGMAKMFWLAVQQSWDEGIAVFRQSMVQDYNDLFTLPSLFSFSLFGSSRLVFIVTNFIVFFVAYEIAAALVLRRAFSLPWAKALLLSFCLCLPVPPLWTPLLEGYPDIGAAACLTFALGLSLQPLGKLRVAAVIGFILALSFLLRRHFAYPVLALLLTKGSFDFYATVWLARAGFRGQSFKRYVFYYLVCCSVLLATIGALAPGLISTVLATDYGSLYLSYKKPAFDFALFALHRFGLLLLGFVFAGYYLAWRTIFKARRGLLLISVFTFTALALWVVGPSQAGGHYLLHVLPLFCVAGLGGLALAVKGRRRLLFGGFIGLMLAVNSSWALWFSPSGVEPDFRDAPGFLSAAKPPVVRVDYDELVALASYLGDTTNDHDVIYALGSSFVFNQDLLRAVSTDVLERSDFAQRFLYGPEIDSRRIAPLNAYASANVYVVPEPAQYHLDPEGQKVITAVARLFPPPAEAAGLFKDDGRVFALKDGVKVRVWRRTGPWAPGLLHALLSNIRHGLSFEAPGLVVLSPPRQAFISNDAAVTAVLSGTRFPLEVFYDAPLSAGEHALTFNFAPDTSCRAFRIVLSIVNDKGTVLEKRVSTTLVPGPVYSSFTAPGASRGTPAFLRLSVMSEENRPCLLAVQKLTVAPVSAPIPLSFEKR